MCDCIVHAIVATVYCDSIMTQMISLRGHLRYGTTEETMAAVLPLIVRYEREDNTGKRAGLARQ